MAIMVLFSIAISFFSLPVVNATETITINPIADANVFSDNPSANYGGDWHMRVAFYDYIAQEDWTRNAYLLFDLSTLSSDVNSINSASLELYQYLPQSPTSQVAVHLCSNTQWNEAEITWVNAPLFSSEQIEVIPVAFVDTWYSWNVTEEVKNSQGGYLTLVLTVANRGDFIEAGFYSKDHIAPEHPRLVIQYEVIPEFPSLIILPLFLTTTVLAIMFRKRLYQTISRH